ncbi:hypothetical protein [Turneriella parva]|uniref:Uncharacterized protein n=1 Tax=Turneriella parva (strain ATCC BAA-1111 / DSM 21527 / NCTC 11395 / H) TaxID=869212 RepID=I4B8A0_TURPD|nr:hypothetical protein [Turneriella parva]AFM13507.1 hypothetical protein Turpa_2868 [Turneriella parva DSM 21527]
MQNDVNGKLIEFSRVFAPPAQKAGAVNTKAGQALILEPRTIRHQERVEDLFYLLFRRTGT